MDIITNNEEMWTPDIGDTIYNIRQRKDRYEYIPLVVRAVHIYKEGIMLTFENFSLGRRMDSLNKLWFVTEEEAKHFCENNKPKPETIKLNY